MIIIEYFRKIKNYIECKLSGQTGSNSTPATFTRSHLKIGNSLLFRNFNLNVRIPMNDKIYLTIGNDSMIGGNFTFESTTGEVVIGDRVYLAGGNIICTNKIEIEDDVFVSWGVYFFDNDSHSINYK